MVKQLCNSAERTNVPWLSRTMKGTHSPDAVAYMEVFAARPEIAHVKTVYVALVAQYRMLAVMLEDTKRHCRREAKDRRRICAIV